MEVNVSLQRKALVLGAVVTTCCVSALQSLVGKDIGTLRVFEQLIFSYFLSFFEDIISFTFFIHIHIIHIGTLPVFEQLIFFFFLRFLETIIYFTFYIHVHYRYRPLHVFEQVVLSFFWRVFKTNFYNLYELGLSLHSYNLYFPAFSNTCIHYKHWDSPCIQSSYNFLLLEDFRTIIFL